MAARRYRVMLNPSCQYGNRILGPEGQQWYNEGINMYRQAMALRHHLQKYEDIEVLVTRDGEDAPSKLADEMAMTAEMGCDLMLAIHSNAPGPQHQLAGGQATFFRDGDAQSHALGTLVHERLLAATREVYPTLQDRGVMTHWKRLAALWSPGCTSALVEIMFHTNPLERPLLLDPSFQYRAGRAMAEALRAYIDQVLVAKEV